jgi:hypothetical protein
VAKILEMMSHGKPPKPVFIETESKRKPGAVTERTPT